MSRTDYKVALGSSTVEGHVGGTSGDSGANPVSLHDGGANVPPSVVVTGNAGKQLRVDTPLAGRITNPA